jgi:hypothetical protein
MEPKYFINLKDILRLQFECKKCKSQVGMKSWEQAQFPFSCPQCGTGWFSRLSDVGDGGNEKAARELVFSILRIANSGDLFEKRGVEIAIEVSGKTAPLP